MGRSDVDETLVLAGERSGRPGAQRLDTCHGNYCRGLGVLGHTHDVGQLGNRHGAHDVVVLDCDDRRHVMLIRWLAASRQPKRSTDVSQGTESALDILNKRYARGEISKQEFEDMRQDLQATV